MYSKSDEALNFIQKQERLFTTYFSFFLEVITQIQCMAI
jgi:hypothetical protein